MTWTPRHLSVSAVQTYLDCPAAYHRRYVLGVLDPPSPAMAWGKAMAQALEAEHRGQDGDVAWLRAFLAEDQALRVQGQRLRPNLRHGLDSLALYRARGVGQGTPEWRFSLYLPNREAVPVPILGYLDLATDTEVWEYKTSLTVWHQARVEGAYQAQVYGWAYQQLRHRRPACVRYLIFSTHCLKLTEFVMQPSGDGLRLFEHAAAATWQGILAEQWAPKCGRCPACREAGHPKTNGGLELP